MFIEEEPTFTLAKAAPTVPKVKNLYQISERAAAGEETYTRVSYEKLLKSAESDALKISSITDITKDTVILLHFDKHSRQHPMVLGLHCGRLGPRHVPTHDRRPEEAEGAPRSSLHPLEGSHRNDLRASPGGLLGMRATRSKPCPRLLGSISPSLRPLAALVRQTKQLR